MFSNLCNSLVLAFTRFLVFVCKEPSNASGDTNNYLIGNESKLMEAAVACKCSHNSVA